MSERILGQRTFTEEEKQHNMEMQQRAELVSSYKDGHVTLSGG